MNLFNYRSAIRRKISGGGIFILLMLATGQVLAQSKAVSGTVKSQQGEPLTGVTILIEGTTQGTSTDAQGAFTLQAKPDDMLAVSYLGYKSQRVKVGTRTKLEVVLTEDQNLMDEVVVVGYGTQRRRNIVGAVENISGEVLENRPNAYLLRSIQGQIPGVNITMADGKPSRSASINIRANTQSIGAGGSALCLIDGVEGDLTAMNPEDVESISVLKDASSTAVYGARGAFGVVLVTTKSARKDKISVDYSGSVSIISETVRPKYETDSQTWYDNYMTAYVGYSHHLPTGINNFFPWTQSWEDEYKKRMNDPDRSYLEWELDASGKYQYYGRNTDWYDLFYKKSTTAHQHNIRISGGGKTSSFIASARYYEQDGIYRVGDEKFRQLNARAKGTVNITKWLTVENNTDFVRRSYHQPTTYAQNLLVRRNLEHQGFPITRVTNPDGTWTAAAVYTGYANMAEGNSYRDNLKFDMKNTTVVTIDLIKDVLVAKADYSYLFNHSRQNDVISQVTYSNGPGIQISYPASSSMRTTETQIEYHSGNANLSFTPRLPEDHSLNVMAGWNIEHKRARNTRMGRDGFIVDGKPNYSLMNGIDYVLEDANSYDWGFVGIFYRASYAYKGKYLAELSGRYDGSSKFPSNERWGFFPSASVGWRMSEENFMKDISWINNIKWRFSIGKAGNGNVSPYKYMELLDFNKAGVIVDGSQRTYTSAPSSVLPANLTWETSSTINLGLDVNLLNNRLSFVGDIYQKETTDMFVTGAELPAVTGYSAPYGNNADMRTRGFEVSLGWTDSFRMANKPFNYSVRLSLWDSKSIITKYTSKSNTLPTLYANAYYEGMELGEIWGYHVVGLFATDEEAQEWGLKAQEKTFWSGDNKSWNAGDLKFADLDESGVVDNGSNRLDDHGDLRKIGNSSPRYHYGINFSANWNGIDFAVFFQGVGKRDWYPAGESGLFWGQYDRPYGYSLPWQNADRWSEDNPNAYWPRLRGSLAVSGRGTLRAANDRYLQKARYCRLKNISLGYTLPQQITRGPHRETAHLRLGRKPVLLVAAEEVRQELRPRNDHGGRRRLRIEDRHRRPGLRIPDDPKRNHRTEHQLLTRNPMKPILNKIAIIAGLSLLASCQSFFDEDPVYSTTTDTFFNSETALETYAIGFLESHLPSAATLTRGDQYSDICVTTQTEGFLKTGGYSAQQANNWARGNWRPLYNVNYYLKHMKDAAPYVDDATMKHYEGVGRFWRAWFYWDKVKTFGDVPWYDEPIDPDDDEQLYKGRDPRDYVMQKVLEDLDFAATWCSKASKYVNTNVINRYVALALKSRICLYEGTWRKYHGLDGSEEWLRACVAASEELMGDSPYSLVSTAGEETTNYSKVFKSEEPQYTEVILANEFNATLNRFHDASWYYASGSYGQRNSGPKAFVNMYLNLDGTRFTDKDGYNKTQFKDEFAGRDYRLRQTFITPYYVKKVGGKETDEFAKVFPGLTTQLTYYRIIKWNTDDDANESNTSSANSLPVFRYAEILLNEAEAKAELGEMDQTVWNKTIRPLRERSGVIGAMPATADPYLASYYDGVTDKWILECRRERSIELYMENTRRDDLMRWRMGHKLTVEFAGIHIPELGKPFDMNGDGKNDLCFYSKSHPKSGSNQTGVSYVEVTAEEGDNVTTYSVNKDNCLVYILDREWADYKYLYPVPKNALDINPNLRPQNPGWDD